MNSTNKDTFENLEQSKVMNIETSNKCRKIYGLSGIKNTGNTCYMNSAIQALSHNYPLTNYLFHNKEAIYGILKKNARKILLTNPGFKLDAPFNGIPLVLRQKIQNENYHENMLTTDEEIIIYNNTITYQLIRLLENMWTRNCIIIPTSFRKIFSEARDKFFFGYEQHDAEEAYSCIIQKMQEELAEIKNIKFKARPEVYDFIQYKNNIISKLQDAHTIEKKMQLLDLYKQKKKEMPDESLIVEAFREMKKYYDTSYNRVTEIFSGFLHSSISCPNKTCGYSSNKFDPFLHLPLPMPQRDLNNKMVHINDCLTEYCKEEILDEQNLWLCEGCNQKVKGIKKIDLWTAPPVLVIQLKRFGDQRISKDSRYVWYPDEHFDISEIISPVQKDPSKCYKYRLQCVVNHRGNLNGGHYYSYCLDEDSNKWFEFNDDRVTQIPKNQIVTNTAYLLSYIREDMINSENILTIDNSINDPIEA